MPHLQKLYTELKDKGFDLIAVNAGDASDRVKKYFADSGFTFVAALGGRPGTAGYKTMEQYGVMAYPTNYLVDGSGKIVWRSVGFDEAGLLAALKQLGLK